MLHTSEQEIGNPMELSEGARRRGMVALLAITFLMYCGFFMVIPLLSFHYVEDMGFAAVIVGAALATRQLLQQGTTLFGGMLADRVGVRGLIGAGVLIRAVGFVSLAWANTPALLILAMVLSALGGALFDAPSRAAMAALTTEEERARYYALTGVVSNIGMVIGPFLGAQLIAWDFQVVCLAAAACFVLVGVTTLFLPPVRVAEANQNIGFGIGLAFHDRPFLIFTGLLMGYWYMWVQMTISLPLAAASLGGGSAGNVSLVYSLNAGLTILLQYPVLGAFERRLRPLSILIVGVALMALGLGAVAVAGSMPALIACVVVFTLGTLLATPTQQTVSAALADPRALGSYFGVNSLALAFGGSLGNFSGGLMFDIARTIGFPALPWLVFAAIGAGCTVGLALLAQQLRRREVTAHLVGVSPPPS